MIEKQKLFLQNSMFCGRCYYKLQKACFTFYLLRTVILNPFSTTPHLSNYPVFQATLTLNKL